MYPHNNYGQSGHQHTQFRGLGEGQCVLPAVNPIPGVNPADYMACMSGRSLPLPPNINWRAALDRLACEIPEPAKSQLLSGAAKFNDHIAFIQDVWSVIATRGNKMWNTSHPVAVGRTNLQDGKLQANQYMIVTGIQVMTHLATGGGLTPDQRLNAANWNRVLTTVPVPAADAVSERTTALVQSIVNGWVNFSLTDTLPREVLKQYPGSVFTGTGENNLWGLTNYYELASPVLVVPGQFWDFNIQPAGTISADLAVRVNFLGGLATLPSQVVQQ